MDRIFPVYPVVHDQLSSNPQTNTAVCTNSKAISLRILWKDRSFPANGKVVRRRFPGCSFHSPVEVDHRVHLRLLTHEYIALPVVSAVCRQKACAITLRW